MNKYRFFSKMWFLALLLVAFVAGCASNGAEVIPGTLVSISITPPLASIPVTGTQQYTLTAIYSDGTSHDVTASSTWASSSVTVATVLPTGVATGKAIGQSSITATYLGKSATATLTVNAATSVSFKVTPALASIPVTGTQQYTAIETFSDGTTIDRTATSTWASVNLPLGGAAVATVSSTLPTKGLATGNSIGQSSISATFGTLSNSVTLTVNAATSLSFKVTPALASMPVTGTQQYTAIETFSDGTTIDRTAASTWTAANVPLGGAAVATVSSTLPTKGFATGNVIGQSSITATFGTLSNSATLTVNAATSVSFKVTPALASIPVTGTQQYTAIETFSDGTTIDRTAASVWAAANVPLGGAAVATVSSTLPTKGLATGNVIGQSSITATFGTLSNSALLTVNAATQASFTVTPATASISITGGSQQFAAIQTFSDGTTIDRTAASTWTSVNLPLGGTVVSTIGLNTGLATGAAIGQSTITATYLGSPATAILTVTAPNTGVAGAAPNLKTAAPFGIIAYNAITNSAGPSHIYGDVALTQPGPGGTIASVTGPGTNDGGAAGSKTSTMVTTSGGVSPGMITAANNGTPTNIAALPQLLLDLRAAYDDLFSRAAPVTPLTTVASAVGVSGGTFPAAAPDLSGYVLSPGIYTTAGTYGLSNTLGPLVLDAGGNPDAVFIIRSTAVGPSGLTSTTGSVVLRNGTQSKNVFWLLDNATIGAGTFFQGTVVAGHAITLLAHANVEGRMLAGALGLVSGAITLTDTNIIAVPK